MYAALRLGLDVRVRMVYANGQMPASTHDIVLKPRCDQLSVDLGSVIVLILLACITINWDSSVIGSEVAHLPRSPCGL